MDENSRTSVVNVYNPKDVDEIFSYMTSSGGNIKIFGGCTQRECSRYIKGNALSIINIEELRRIEKKDRYIEFGPGITLSEILNLGKQNIPAILYDAIESIGSIYVRNQATIGGNICASVQCDVNQKMTLWAPLLALGTSLDFKIRKRNSKNKSYETKNIPLSKFLSIPENGVLTKIKIPITDWETTIFKRLGPANSINENSSSFVFLLGKQKDSISNVRIVFTGRYQFYSPNSPTFENEFFGVKLPLQNSEKEKLLRDASTIFDKQVNPELAPPIFKKQFMNLMEQCLNQIS